MMKNSDESKTHFFVEADYQRKAVPSTQALQASILESAKQTSQHGAPEGCHSVPAASPARFFSWRPSLTQSAVLVTSMLICSVGLFFVGFGDQQQGIGTEQKITFEAFSEDDLDWQELMLIDDELLFAQL